MSFQPPPSSSFQHLQDSKGSFGPAIGVVAAILVLAVISAIVGRLCSGGRVYGFGNFDFKRWIGTKYSSCIDGKMNSHPPHPPTIPVQTMTSPPANQAATSTANRTARMSGEGSVDIV